MTSIPSAVELLLKQHGFAATEILVLRQLFGGEALTLRELAAKTGKSTGVLDLATRKLMERHILKRVLSNKQSKYVLQSLSAICDWLHRHTEAQIEELRRQEECIASYMRTQQQALRRPDVQYFEGDAGLAMAMSEVCKRGEKELLCFLPVACKEEEDPLLMVRQALTAERKRSGTVLRVLAPNTPLGRRFQARDAFECRQTVLMEPARFPLTQEKIIGGHTVATFNHGDERAFLLTCPELAEDECRHFGTLWQQYAPSKRLDSQAGLCDTPATCSQEVFPSCSPASTKKPTSKRP